MLAGRLKQSNVGRFCTHEPRITHFSTDMIDHPEVFD